MYDELIKRLRNMATNDGNIKSNYIGLTLLQAADAIEELQAQLMYSNDAAKAIAEKVPKWIPVTERLPEERLNTNTLYFEYVLCATIWGDVRPFEFGTPFGWGEPHFWNRSRLMDEYVTHWMPLPEPPKEG